MAGVDQAIDDELAIEFAAGDELRQTEGATVEGMIAPAGSGAGERFDLTLERGATVRLWLATRTDDALILLTSGNTSRPKMVPRLA